MKSYIRMCSKGSNNGSVEGLSVETAITDEDLHHFPIDTFPQLFEEQWPQDGSTKRSERYLFFIRYCSLRTCQQKEVRKQTFLWNLIYECAPRAPVTDQRKGYLWKPQMQVRICAIFLLTPFHSYSRMSNTRQDCVWFMHGCDPSYASIIRTLVNDKYL